MRSANLPLPDVVRLKGRQSCPVENTVDSVGNLGSFAVDSSWISCGFLGEARPFGHPGLPFLHPLAVDKVAFAVGRLVGAPDAWPRRRYRLRVVGPSSGSSVRGCPMPSHAEPGPSQAWPPGSRRLRRPDVYECDIHHLIPQ